jgi:nicotinamidase-related amidase
MNDQMLEVWADRCAVVVVDMQNDFCHLDGYYAGSGRDVIALQSVVDPIRRLLEQARAAGMPVVFTRLLHDQARGAMQDRHRLVPRRWTARGRRLQPGSWGAQVIDDLAPRPGDLVVDKSGYSAFDRTGLEEWLRQHRITTLLITGVVGYACVLATGFAAFDRDFDVVLVRDAVASWDTGLGRATESIVDLLLGHAVRSDQLVIRSHHDAGAARGPAPGAEGSR